MTAQFNADILGRLGEATADELNAALAAIRADAAELETQTPTPASAKAYSELVGHAEAVHAALTAHRDAVTTLASKKAKLADLTAPDPEPAAPAIPDKPADVPAPEASGEGSGNADTQGDHATAPGSGSGGTSPADDDKPDDEPDDEPKNGDDTNTDGEDTTVTASGRRPLGNGGNASTAPATIRPPQVHLITTVAGGVDTFNAGQQLDRRGLSAAFSAKAKAVGSRNVSGYERYTVATVRSEYPEGRMLRRGVDAFANMERVERVVDEHRARHARDNVDLRVQLYGSQSGADATTALTAAGLCAPLETLYDIRTIGDVDRPVRDALVRFGADRGGIQYRPALDGVTQTGGIGVWTVTDDEDTTPTPKTCVEIDCPGILSAEVDAIYQCLTFSNMSTRFDPEWMDSTIRAQAIAHARFAENRLLTQLTTASKTLYSQRTLGATRDTLFTLDKITAYYRNVHRYNREVPLRWIAPAWALNMMRADITRQMVGDGLQSLAVTDAQILAWLAERNINATFHLDGIDPADITVPDPDVVVPAQFYTLSTTGTEVKPFPAAMSTLLFADGDWLYLDGGTLDLGVVRDSTLNGLNRFQTFSESFEVPAFRGIETIHLVIQAQPTGESAATADTTP